MNPMFRAPYMKNYTCQLSFYNFDLTRHMIEKHFAKKIESFIKTVQIIWPSVLEFLV